VTEKEHLERDRAIAQKLGMTPDEIEYIRSSRIKLCMKFKHMFALHRDLDDPSTFAYCKDYLQQIRERRELDEIREKALDAQLEEYMDHSDDIDALEERGNEIWD
jgi:hypothetical protein